MSESVKSPIRPLFPPGAVRKESGQWTFLKSWSFISDIESECISICLSSNLSKISNLDHYWIIKKICLHTNGNSDIIYSSSCHSKPVWLEFPWMTKLEILNNCTGCSFLRNCKNWKTCHSSVEHKIRIVWKMFVCVCLSNESQRSPENDGQNVW